jgi:hypothetical protein
MAAPTPSAPAASTAAPETSPPAPSASSDASSAKSKHYHPKTLDEARAAAHARADKLDKMTEAQWEAQQGKRHAWREKWKHMTPEEKAAYKKARYAKRHSGDTTTAPSDSAPSSTSAN